MQSYFEGLTILGGDVGTGTVESVDLPAYGPGGEGGVYTDKPTILAVQKSLKARGYNPGPLDGIFGTKTEAALYKFSGEHGPPSASTLAKLGVKPGGAPAGVSKGALVKHAEVSTSPIASVKNALTAPSPIAGLPWWQIALGSLGVIAISIGIYQAFKS